MGDLPSGAPHGNVGFPSAVTDNLYGFITNRSWWHIDDPFQRGVIIRVAGEAQIGEGIFDFGTFKEALTTVNAIRKSGTEHGLFQHTGLGIGAIENRNIAVSHAFTNGFPDALGDKARLINFVKTGVDPDWVTINTTGPEIFAETIRIVGNKSVGRF